MVEEAFLLHCLSPGEAAELIRPLLRLGTNTIVHSPARAPRVLTIRATPAQMETCGRCSSDMRAPGHRAARARASPAGRAPFGCNLTLRFVSPLAPIIGVALAGCAHVRPAPGGYNVSSEGSDYSPVVRLAVRVPGGVRVYACANWTLAGHLDRARARALERAYTAAC